MARGCLEQRKLLLDCAFVFFACDEGLSVRLNLLRIATVQQSPVAAGPDPSWRFRRSGRRSEWWLIKLESC